jgi:citrate lyase beta subunit
MRWAPLCYALRGPDILEVVYGIRFPSCARWWSAQKMPWLRSTWTVANLRTLLQIDARGGRSEGGPLLFVRPRDARMAAVLNDWPLMKHVDGFVVPKPTLGSLVTWERAVGNPELRLMPTLETADVYNPGAMTELGQALKESLDQRIIALRIGGNDLMGCLGLRRNPATTLYATPMSYVIPMLAGVMGAQGFALTAPVFEQLASPHLLQEELELTSPMAWSARRRSTPTRSA